MGKQEILEFLYEREGEYVSGGVMSEKLGVSRTAIWKHITALREQGYEIGSIPNKGYCLMGSPVLLEREKISVMLGESVLGRELFCFSEIDSTNTEVKRRALEGACEGLVVASSMQTAGRGRRGRSFYSPQEGLYLSVLLRPLLSSGEVVDFTAWVAVAVCRGIYRYCGIYPEIKWTNDIVFQGKKLCGILTELTLEMDSDFVQFIVVGIGINCKGRGEDFPEELQEMAISLEEILGKTVNLSELCGAIIFALNEVYLGFPHENKPILDEYRKNCVTLNRDIMVLRGEEKRVGTALEIDEKFSLLVKYDTGERELLSSGEVSVRGMCGYT